MPEDIISYEIGYFGSLLNNKMTLDVKLFKEEISPVIGPVRDYRNPDEDDPPDTPVLWGETPFLVTKDQPGMDSIINLPFALRIDSLQKYIEIEYCLMLEVDLRLIYLPQK